DKYYPIYTNDEVTPLYDLLVEYRSRQNHELCYRVMKHDLNSRPRMNSKSGNLFCPLDSGMQQLMSVIVNR
ncbi:hypothetical protein C5S53_15590, partial [Methanophagales archaeon]